MEPTLGLRVVTGGTASRVEGQGSGRNRKYCGV